MSFLARVWNLRALSNSVCGWQTKRPAVKIPDAKERFIFNFLTVIQSLLSNRRVQLRQGGLAASGL
jgi:hypothetical protein